jgi:hypothetical protein
VHATIPLGLMDPGAQPFVTDRSAMSVTTWVSVPVLGPKSALPEYTAAMSCERGEPGDRATRDAPAQRHGRAHVDCAVAELDRAAGRPGFRNDGRAERHVVVRHARVRRRRDRGRRRERTDDRPVGLTCRTASGPAGDQLLATPSKPSAEDSAPSTTIRVSSTNTPAAGPASSVTSAIDSSTWPPTNDDRSNATSRQPPVDPVKEFQTPLVPGASQFVQIHDLGQAQVLVAAVDFRRWDGGEPKPLDRLERPAGDSGGLRTRERRE